MIFIILAKFRKKPTSEDVSETPKGFLQAGAKLLSGYWTLGRYDAVLTVDAPDERTIMKTLLKAGDFIATETMVAIPRDEAIKLL